MKADVQTVTLPGSAPPAQHHNETYLALVWRRLRRSWTGMTGLILVCLLMLMAIFAEFFSPVDPKLTGVAFAPPQTISITDQEGNLVWPRTYQVGEGTELDPITFQPIVGPDYANPKNLGFFVKGFSYRLLGLIPTDRHFFGATDGTPVNFLGTDKFGRDVLSRIFYGSRVSLMIALTVVFIVTVVGTTVGMVSGYFGGRFDAWMQRFVELVLAFPQLPLYLALTSLIPVTAPTNVFLAFVIFVMSALGWAQMSREVRGKTLALGPDRICPGCDGDRRHRPAHHLPAYFPERHEPRHCRRDASNPERGSPGILPRLSRLCSEAAANLLGADVAGYRHLFRHRILSLDPFPVAFVLVTVFAFNALGDGLRDAVDPY